MKPIVGTVAFASMFLIFVPLASAQHGAHEQIMANYRSFPDAQATVSSAKDTTLVHRKSPSHYKVCFDSASSGPVAVTHDDSMTEIDPGNCANVEASRISAKASSDGHNRISVWEKEHAERMMDQPRHN